MDFRREALIAALQWHIDVGAAEALADAPSARVGSLDDLMIGKAEEKKENAPTSPIQSSNVQSSNHPLAGTAALRAEAVKLAKVAMTLDDLKSAIAAFDGLAIKATAKNLVFCDGNPQAPVMLVGEAPGADEDIQGKPFVGVSGKLLDRILKTISLDRAAADPTQSIYISNILNWRPPGNRTPTDSEIEMSLPFIERHIVLARPKLLVFSGGVSAKALLGSGLGISKLRGRWHDYRPRTEGIAEGVENAAASIPALATYHPAYLLRTPSQKRAVWHDMLALREKMMAMGVLKRGAA